MARPERQSTRGVMGEATYSDRCAVRRLHTAATWRLSAVPPSSRPPACSPASGHGSDPPSFTAGRFSPRGALCQA